ncbi:MAG TPA: hypothetical protein DD383_04780 [Rikenellaceae bacterium]|nr:hypothetical protein [Rikenellaceae bacterium]HCQ72944.1 hypothetical protein [Rikenellaceae bacterium]
MIMAEDFKTVAKFNDAMSAHITAGMLNENGIPAAVFGENSSYVSLNYVDPIEVKVNAADYDAAKALLAQNEQTDKAVEH